MDLDGDGYLSMYELEYFYEEQLQRMEAIGIETLPFEDCLCQVHLPSFHIYKLCRINSVLILNSTSYKL